MNFATRPFRFCVRRSANAAGVSLLSLALLSACSSVKSAPRSVSRPDVVITDFDEDSTAWSASGDAFNRGPASGDVLRTLEIENAVGATAASSEQDGDRPQGALRSPPFIIVRDSIEFRIGGGDYEYSTCLNLLVDGKIVRSQTGWRSDFLTPSAWDVRPWAGKEARLELVDRSSGDWGHINVDHIVQTDLPERTPLAVGALYDEALRPQFHFTARQWAMTRLNPGMQQEGWINDLNGLIYCDGEYHLFAQRWAKCWLHAVSTDLVHWTELPPAFWEEEQGSGVQSGTIVVDTTNTSGLGTNGSPPMVAFWSRFDNRSQCISYSTDHGRTWTMYKDNPLFIHPERDPKVFWYAPNGHWVMMMYGDGKYHILTSDNLLRWTDQEHPLADCFECPDLFELPLDGDPARRKWVMIQGSGMYSIGSFDGTRFQEEGPRRAVDIGPNFYATQTWGNVETGDQRRVQAAWMRGGHYPDMPFNQQVSFPCVLTLRTTSDGVRLFREPVRELELLQEAPDQWAARTLRDGQTLPLEAGGSCYRIVAELTIAEHAKAVFDIRGSRVVLGRREIESGGATGTLTGDIRRVELLVDRSSIETFVNEGEISSSRCIIPSGSGISLHAEGGDVELRTVSVWPLRSAWTKEHAQQPR